MDFKINLHPIYFYELNKMEFLKKLLGISNKPQEIKKEITEISLIESREFAIRARDAKLAPFYASSRQKVIEILDLFKEIQLRFGEFSRKEIKIETPEHEKIARQMKENYFERIPKLLSQINAPKGSDYSDLLEFHSQANGVISQIGKITSDNRYLIFFFREDFEKLEVPLRALAKKMDEFGREISLNEKYLKEFGDATGILEKIIGLESEIVKAKEAKMEMEGNAKGLLEKQGKQEDGIETEIGLEKSKILDLENQISRERGEIANIILPLQRVFRKFSRIALEKRLSLLSDEFSNDYFGEISGEAGDRKLLELIEEVGKQLISGNISEDTKDREKHLELIARIKAGAIAASLERLRPLESSKMLAQESLKNLEEELGKREGLKRELETLEKGILEKEALAASDKDKILEWVALLEIKLFELSGKTVKIRAE